MIHSLEAWFFAKTLFNARGCGLEANFLTKENSQMTSDSSTVLVLSVVRIGFDKNFKKFGYTVKGQNMFISKVERILKRFQ